MTRCLSLPLCLLLLGGPAAAGRAADLAFGPVRNYPNLGFGFACLDNAKADPLPLPHAYPYLLADEEALVREDRFEPFELWYGLQCCGRWRTRGGDELVLGRIANRLPLFNEKQVSRDRFAAALADDENLLDPRDTDQVDEWVATFAGTPLYAPEALKLNSFSLDALRYYPSPLTNTVLYAFRPRQLGSNTNPDWFFVKITAPGSRDSNALRQTVETSFIGRLTLPPRTARDEGARAEELDVSRKGLKDPDQPNHPVRLEARKSIENYEAWWFAEMDGYIILSDVATEVGKSVIRDLQDTMPALRKAFEKLLPPLTLENDVALIRIFQSKGDYVRHVGADYAWSGAVWMPGRRELALTQEINKEEMMRVIRHESFHQYLSHAYCMLAAAPWLNEGHACLFESAKVDAKGKVTLEEDPGRVTLLLENLERVTAYLPVLLQSDYEAFYAGSALERKLKYAAAWGLAYYLHKGAPRERNTPFKNILPDFAASLARQHRYPAATAEAFAKVDLRVFQDNFREFWLKRRASAMQADPLND